MDDWREIGERLVRIAGDDWLSPEMAERIGRQDRLSIACSGGADSVFLALYFAAREPAGNRRLSILHFNHQLRGEASDLDERFVDDLRTGLGLPWSADRWNREDADAEVSEEAARKARMAFFVEELSHGGKGTALLTGHHADDIAETFLMRLSRGSGLQGLSAPREFSEGPNGLALFRPLLTLRKRQLVEWLEAAGAVWREDASNESDQYYRNRLRNRVIPEWEAASDRSPQEGASLSRALLEEDWLALESAFEEAWKRIAGAGGTISWHDFRDLPKALQRRAIHRLVLERQSEPISIQAMDGILESARRNESFKTSLDDSRWLVGEAGGRIGIEERVAATRWPEVAFPPRTKLCFPNGASLISEEIPLSAELSERIRSGTYSHNDQVFLRLDKKHSSTLRVRQWSPGDAYWPMGRTSPVKLKTLFIDRKIPRQQRREAPVIIDDRGEILWVPGLPPGQSTGLTADTTRALRLTYQQ